MVLDVMRLKYLCLLGRSPSWSTWNRWIMSSVFLILYLCSIVYSGKTLTAESVAEILRRPLYMVGSTELPTNSSGLEMRLRGILSVSSPSLCGFRLFIIIILLDSWLLLGMQSC